MVDANGAKEKLLIEVGVKTVAEAQVNVSSGEDNGRRMRTPNKTRGAS